MGVEQWPDAGLERVLGCPVCGSARARELYEGLRDRVFLTAAGAWELQLCAGCGSAFLDPRPTPETIGLAYRTYYTHEPSEPTPGFRGSIDRLLPGGTPAVANVVKDLELQPGDRCLDVGSGDGAVVGELRRRGVDALGLDPDPVAVEAAQAAGLPVEEGTLVQDRFQPGSFDAIVLNHVLEHLHDPGATLRECARALVPGGRLWLATPNLRSRGHARYGRDWLHLDPPRHLVLFTRESLTGLVSSSGFDVLRLGGSRTATLVYPASEVIARGGRPMEDPPPRRSLLAARAADLLGLVRPAGSEELVVCATARSA